MKISSISICNFGPFKELHRTRIGTLGTIVGQNDVGKTSILEALDLFFSSGKPKIGQANVNSCAGDDEDITIGIEFCCLPESIELEDGVPTSLDDELLLNHCGCLHVKKVFPRSDLTKPQFRLVVEDYSDESFSGLTFRKENELNSICQSLGIDASRSGRGVTNRSKRQAIREKAQEQGIALAERELPVPANHSTWKALVNCFPQFEFFQTDTKLDVGETTFQNRFNAIIAATASRAEVATLKEEFENSISGALQAEVDLIFTHLQNHTDAFTSLRAHPNFTWEKAVSFEIIGKDHHNIEASLDRRGSGMRRLLMVAFFQYLAEKSREGNQDFVFAVEEPENCLHPRLQRELVRSFRKLADLGHQIIITTHSPVFVGASPIEDLALVVRCAGIAESKQHPDLDLSEVAEELGVEPADQITGYKACVFVEGSSDVFFWEQVAQKLKESGEIESDLADREIGFALLGGGDSLKHWINMRALKRLNRRYAVIIDSDRRCSTAAVAGRKLRWKECCENDGGLFFITRKREIENYLHKDALRRSGLPDEPFDDFSDMKQIYGKNVYKVVRDMNCAELLEMDRYEEDGHERHELKEIVVSLLSLVST